MDEQLNTLTKALARQGVVRAIALSGGDRPLPKPGEGDIDLFVYCSAIPALDQRLRVYSEVPTISGLSPDRLQGGRWGVADSMVISGVETWVMYFTVAEADVELASILSGKQPGKQENYFYPTGRLSMMLNFRVLYDVEGYLERVKDRLRTYPDELGQTLYRLHLNALEDREDLLRAVSRRDVLFYHFALDLALDHFLQALFALNRVYFPSRKRSVEYIEGFALKPEQCSERLLEVVHLGGSPTTLAQSYQVLCVLIDWLEQAYEEPTR